MITHLHGSSVQKTLCGAPIGNGGRYSSTGWRGYVNRPAEAPQWMLPFCEACVARVPLVQLADIELE